MAPFSAGWPTGYESHPGGKRLKSSAKTATGAQEGAATTSLPHAHRTASAAAHEAHGLLLMAPPVFTRWPSLVLGLQRSNRRHGFLGGPGSLRGAEMFVHGGVGRLAVVRADGLVDLAVHVRGLAQVAGVLDRGAALRKKQRGHHLDERPHDRV